ncbi:type II toxin-antitoxin system RelB family antitoxin [Sphingobium sp. HWE2-09]|uniref:type II toxin-antitoxin system RelB family antitoxin n=1 Tax=Sphingobium sp. HWE2-09 TaxID=3108390 RepID=UPI002DC218BA|nr:stability determinant [Sphingobium sp. HWE2-09]
MNEHTPLTSEFDTPEQAIAWEIWLNAKVAASLADQRPPVAHDEAMARARAIIQAKARDGA